MASLTDFDIKTHNDTIKKELQNIPKPLTAYQLYTKAMREQWVNLTDDQKDTYLLQAKKIKIHSKIYKPAGSPVIAI